MHPSLTEFYEAVSALSYMLRLSGSPGTPDPRTIELIEGSPEGIVEGVPGDIRIDVRSPSRLWIKRTGAFTKTGWQEIAGGGGGTVVCGDLPEPVVPGSAGAVGASPLASPCDHQHPMDPVAVPLQGIRVQGLNAGGAGLGVGAVNDTVAWWGGATQQIGAVPFATWVQRADDADDGTTFKITQAGIYEVLFEINTGAGGISGAQNAITYDAPAGMLNTTPDIFVDPANVMDMDYVFGLPVGQAAPLRSSRLVYVSSADAAGALTGILRGQLSDLANGPPPATTVSLTNALWEMRLVAQAR